MSDFCASQKPCSHKSNGRNLPGCFCPLPDLPAQHHLFLHDGKEFLRGLSSATPDPGCSMEIANVKCLAGVLLLPHAGCYEREDSVVTLVAPAGESPVPGLISEDALLHPVQEARCQAFPSGYTAVLSRQCPVPDEKTIGSSTMECILSFVTPLFPGASQKVRRIDCGLRPCRDGKGACHAHGDGASSFPVKGRALYGPPVSGWESAFRGCSGKR